MSRASLPVWELGDDRLLGLRDSCRVLGEETTTGTKTAKIGSQFDEDDTQTQCADLVAFTGKLFPQCFMSDVLHREADAGTFGAEEPNGEGWRS